MGRWPGEFGHTSNTRAVGQANLDTVLEIGVPYKVNAMDFTIEQCSLQRAHAMDFTIELQTFL